MPKCTDSSSDQLCVTASQLADGGCTAPDGNEPVQVEDPRVLRRYLVLHLAEEADTKAAFTNSMQVALQEQAVLGSALLPMEISAEVCFRLQANICHHHEHLQLVGYSCWTLKS